MVRAQFNLISFFSIVTGKDLVATEQRRPQTPCATGEVFLTQKDQYMKEIAIAGANPGVPFNAQDLALGSGGRAGEEARLLAG